MLGRAILLRCPRCGGGKILRNWFNLKEHCPTCAQRFDRGESSDYWLGGYTINLVVAEGASLAAALLCLAWRWPDATLALWVGVTMAVLAPVGFFPFSRTLWLAVDLKFRPVAEKTDL